MKVKDFFDNEFKQYSIADCVRSIPSLIDGFKPSQRKCIFGMIKRGNSGEIKVASASGWISQCLDKDTVMHLVDGSTVTIGDLALVFNNGIEQVEVNSYNELTGLIELDICENVWETKIVDHIIDIELSTGELISLTEEHVVYTIDGNKEVKDLSIGDRIVSYYSDSHAITNITTRKYDAPQPVYDATIRKNHNFFIGKSKILVHNCSDYHHGEDSLNKTIVGLAQNYTGSNNINYFKPIGQFGSRLSSEASAPRYIFTQFTDDFRKIFKKEDDIILNHLESDGVSIEPDFYLPVLPNILINGSRGMGTGYATNILTHNPADLRDNILQLLSGKDPDPIVPWFKGFKGQVSNNADGQTINIGVYEIINTTTIHITELPIGVYLDDYKTHLFKLQDMGLIKDFDDFSNEDSFKFVVNVPRTTTQLTHEVLLTKFKLISRDTQNITAWTEEGVIKVFKCTQDLIDYFVDFRLAKYEERRLKQIELLTEEVRWLNEKKRFIEYYIENSRLLSSKTKKELDVLLREQGFTDINSLLDIKIYNLTKDAIISLDKQIESIEKELLQLSKTNCIKMYVKELKELEF